MPGWTTSQHDLVHQLRRLRSFGVWKTLFKLLLTQWYLLCSVYWSSCIAAGYGKNLDKPKGWPALFWGALTHWMRWERGEWWLDSHTHSHSPHTPCRTPGVLWAAPLVTVCSTSCDVNERYRRFFVPAAIRLHSVACMEPCTYLNIILSCMWERKCPSHTAQI